MKALAMFSGGLDSILAIRLVQEAGVEVEAVHFLIPFLQDFHRLADHKRRISDAAAQLDVNLHFVPLGEDYLRIIEKPRFGYGKNLNPCIDCRIFQLEQAARLMRAIGASFLVTGEVLGQRPKSQHEAAFNIAEREAGLRGLILRPLSASRLKPTIPEERGWIERKCLLGIMGRGRYEQMDLASRWGLRYPSPGGGCLLTMQEYSARLGELLADAGSLDMPGVALLRLGRHFRIAAGVKAIIGRDQTENLGLMWAFHSAPYGRTLMKVSERPGPLTLVTGPADENMLELAARMTAAYVKNHPGEFFTLRGLQNGRHHWRIGHVEPLPREELDKYRIG